MQPKPSGRFILQTMDDNQRGAWHTESLTHCTYRILLSLRFFRYFEEYAIQLAHPCLFQSFSRNVPETRQCFALVDRLVGIPQTLHNFEHNLNTMIYEDANFRYSTVTSDELDTLFREFSEVEVKEQVHLRVKG